MSFREVRLSLWRIVYLRVRIDWYSCSFFSLLILIRSSVFIWSYYYLDGEVRFTRFSYLLITFLIAIIVLIFVSNLFMSLIGWDCLGLSSFLLIIYYKNRKSLGSGMMTALSNRIGDCFFMVCLGCGSLDVSLLFLILLCMTKRAQVPFTAWLPSAMAAPTPVRALVHSSTLVTAGVYLLIRYCSVDCVLLLGIGCITLLLAGICACVERDLKKVVALSTISQLGVMFISLGAAQKSYCFFHLMSHALFKALLFICVGVSIHCNYGTQDYRAGHITYLLFSFTVFARLSLIGFLFTSGFYRKDLILERLYRLNSFYLASFLFGIFLTSCYTWKMIWNIAWATSTPCLSSVGGARWTRKYPHTTCAVARLLLGTQSPDHAYVGNEKLFPILIIARGAFLGWTITRYNSREYARQLTLIPNSQWFSRLSKSPQILDKGWVEVVSRSPSVFSRSVSHAAFVIGIFIFMFYGKCL